MPDMSLDPYDNPLVMPLAEWVEHPIARELAHEGAALQLLGLSNASRWGPDAHALRRCFFADPGTRAELTRRARGAARRAAGVGLLERLHDSVSVLAASLGEAAHPAWLGVPRKAPLCEEWM